MSRAEPGPTHRRIAARVVRAVVALAAVGLGVVALVERWSEVRRAAAHLDPGAVFVALLAVLAGLAASMLAWRALLADLGSRLPVRAAGRIFFVGQLGKYLPGSVWWLVGQVELARACGIPRRRSATVAVLTVGLALGCGLAVAAVTLPLLSRGAAIRYWPAFAVVPVALVVLQPRVLNGGLGRMLRLARREPLERPLTGRGVGIATGWSLLGWLAYGGQIAVLVAALGATGARVLPLSVGAFALAWSVGFVAVLAPAGLGVREVVLIAGLAPVLPSGGALVVAIASRALMTAGDLLCAGVAAFAGRSRVVRTTPGPNRV